MVTMKVRCPSPNKVQRRKSLEGGEMTRNDSVDRFMCELIVGVKLSRNSMLAK
jgi:hypothetical protein